MSMGSSGSSIDKDAEESRGLSMGLFANGILFGLQVLHTGNVVDVCCCSQAGSSLPRLHRALSWLVMQILLSCATVTEL